jgi:hypothetical protein
VALRALVVVLSAAAVATSQAPAASRPTSRALCALDDFANAPGPYRRARPAAGTKPARIDAEDSCVSGDLARCRRIPLDPASTWIAGARVGDFVCVTEGATSGWVRHDELLLEPAAERPIADWRGTWEHEAGSATVTISSKDDRTLEVKGEATWAAGPDAEPHVGTLEGRARASGIELVLGDPRCVVPDRGESAPESAACSECHARLLLVGAALVVADNHNCGGLNVNFDGAYRRRPR